MKNILFWFLFTISAFCWPYQFFVKNPHQWYQFAAVSLLVFASFVLYQKKSRLYQFTYLAFPLINLEYIFIPALAIPLIVLKSLNKIFAGLYLAALILIASIGVAKGVPATVFSHSPLEVDHLIKRVSLVPDRQIGRIFFNKLTLVSEKYKSNLFSLLDQNNYFFEFHPREIPENQNLAKFPPLALLIFLYSLIYLYECVYFYWFVESFTIYIFSLAFLSNFDKFDVVLWLPISLVLYLGLKKIIYGKTQFN